MRMPLPAHGDLPGHEQACGRQQASTRPVRCGARTRRWPATNRLEGRSGRLPAAARRDGAIGGARAAESDVRDVLGRLVARISHFHELPPNPAPVLAIGSRFLGNAQVQPVMQDVADEEVSRTERAAWDRAPYSADYDAAPSGRTWRLSDYARPSLPGNARGGACSAPPRL
jgi:hypothetical protein